jgi:molybdopterin/thiamine biosynthesis adenylyltransferase
MDRYSSQQLYKNIGKKGQKKLSNSSVCIIGIGALGTVCIELLVRAGVGRICIIDRDFIELTNLQRQTLFEEKDIGKAKATTAKRKLKRINSEIRIEAKIDELSYKNANSIIKHPDIILACTDNMESRFLINDYSLKNRIPWIYGAVLGEKGSVYVIDTKGPCFRCIFKGAESETCDTIGILNTTSTIIGSMMANETLKYLLGKKYEHELIYIDIWRNKFENYKVKKRENCESCNGNFQYLNGEKQTSVVKICGEGIYQFKSKHNFLELEKKLKRVDDIQIFFGLFHFRNLTIFHDGRVIVKAENEKKARSDYSKYIGN